MEPIFKKDDILIKFKGLDKISKNSFPFEYSFSVLKNLIKSSSLSIYDVKLDDFRLKFNDCIALER